MGKLTSFAVFVYTLIISSQIWAAPCDWALNGVWKPSAFDTSFAEYSIEVGLPSGPKGSVRHVVVSGELNRYGIQILNRKDWEQIRTSLPKESKTKAKLEVKLVNEGQYDLIMSLFKGEQDVVTYVTNGVEDKISNPIQQGFAGYVESGMVPRDTATSLENLYLGRVNEVQLEVIVPLYIRHHKTYKYQRQEAQLERAEKIAKEFAPYGLEIVGHEENYIEFESNVGPSSKIGEHVFTVRFIHPDQIEMVLKQLHLGYGYKFRNPKASPPQ
ncbi:hypothetical protein GW916_04710 [bacterium]|nr:hypothetical protein [bacterium]